MITQQHNLNIFKGKIHHNFYLFIYFCLFGATPLAHGGSQARSQIGAIAASLRHTHSNAGSEQYLQPTPLSKARDLTHMLMDRSQIRFHCATMVTPQNFLF